MNAADIRLTAAQEAMLRQLDANGGRLWINRGTATPDDVRTVGQLARLGMLVDVKSWPGPGQRLTGNGRSWLAAHPKEG
jgi:hypothetical protein